MTYYIPAARPTVPRPVLKALHCDIDVIDTSEIDMMGLAHSEAAEFDIDIRRQLFEAVPTVETVIGDDVIEATLHVQTPFDRALVFAGHFIALNGRDRARCRAIRSNFIAIWGVPCDH